ncbi:hypothetical protein Q1695_010340 [Nippostrongylus brasiliensis]|nr:hypothetical protein Q1695_010340 [Nippostrongylus brasiliensis]
MPFYSIPSRTRVSKSSGFLRVTEKRWLGVAHGGHENFCATSDKIQSARITWKEGFEQKCLIHNLDVTLYSVELPLNTEDSCVYRKDIVWCNRGQLKKKIWLMQAIIGSEGIPKEMIRCMLANCMTELMEELSISVGYSQSTISDEFIQELRNSYSSLLKKEKKDEDQLLMFIICATIFYACFAIVAGYESVALLISEVKKHTQKTGQSKSKSTN